MIFLSFYSSEIVIQIRVCTYDLAGFLTHRNTTQRTSKFSRRENKCEVQISCVVLSLSNVCIQFFCLIFQLEYNSTFARLNDTGFTITEIGLFFGGENTGSENMQIPDFLKTTWRCLNNLIRVEFRLILHQITQLTSRGTAE